MCLLLGLGSAYNLCMWTILDKVASVTLIRWCVLQSGPPAKSYLLLIPAPINSITTIGTKLF